MGTELLLSDSVLTDNFVVSAGPFCTKLLTDFRNQRMKNGNAIVSAFKHCGKSKSRLLTEVFQFSFNLLLIVFVYSHPDFLEIKAFGSQIDQLVLLH